MSSIIGGTTGVTFPDGTTQSTAATQTNPAGSTGQIQYNNGGSFGAVSSGTSGQVLTSQGSGSAPTFATLSSAKPINVQTFTSSGTWTKPTGYGASARVFIQAWGGGASGAKGQGGGSLVGGGGGGGFNCRWINLACLGATETVTIGAGGASVNTRCTAGNDGGNTTFGSWITAYGGGKGNQCQGGCSAGGGGGGQLSKGNNCGPGWSGRPNPVSLTKLLTINANAGSYLANAFEGGGGTARSTNCYTYHGADSNKKGGGGGGMYWDNTCCHSRSGKGGKSVWGGGGGGGAGWNTTSCWGGTSSFGGNGGAGSSSTSSAIAGTQPGGGGGAAFNPTNTSGTAPASGAGGAGQIIVTVFDGS